MILVDTNVVSEMMRVSPNVRVRAWLNAQTEDALFVSAVSLAELWLGVALLPQGRRRRDLTATVAERIADYFGARLLPFDAVAAEIYAQIVADARVRGVTIGMADGQIAATALVQGLAVATRDTTPFVAAGLRVIDPWTAPTPD
ncbi:MAG: type II toxin-antitoxin system VapC family toxin [Alphaproteobacteria bacterium]